MADLVLGFMPTLGAGAASHSCSSVGLVTLGSAARSSAVTALCLSCITTLGVCAISLCRQVAAASISLIVLAVLLNNSASRSNSSRLVSPRLLGTVPFNVSVSVFAACTIASACDTVGAVMSLCLNIVMVSVTLVARVSLMNTL